MDPQQCLDILTKAGTPGEHCDHCTPEGTPVNGTGGQVIDIVTGENSSSAESVLQKFPALKTSSPGSGGYPVGGSGGSGGYSVEASAAPPVAAAAPTAATAGGEPALQMQRTAITDAEEAALASWKATESSELCTGVLELQAERVQVFKAFDGAFEECLSQGPVGLGRSYPTVVSRATERFSAISMRIRAAAVVLKDRGASEKNPSLTEASSLIRKLQGFEKTRLELVAALHLERSRFEASRTLDSDADAVCSPCATPEVEVLEKNMVDLKKKIGKTDQEIEETISEFRSCKAELDGDY